MAEMHIAMRKAAEAYVGHLSPVLTRLNVDVEEVMNGLWQEHTALLVENQGGTVAVLWRCEFSTNPENIAMVMKEVNQAKA